MQAIVLAGGKGTRLKPYTTLFPKPLVPIGNQPILEVIVLQLRSAGFGRLDFAVNHLAELIRAYFGDGSRWNMDIRYSMETSPLGTAGPIGIVKDVDDRFLVMNGDVLSNIDYQELWETHLRSGAVATIATCEKRVPISLGVLQVDGKNGLIGYTEKPTLSYRVSMGIYVFERRVVDFIHPNQHLDLPSLMLNLLAAGERVNCFDFKGTWLDIGNPDDYALANELFEKEDVMFLPQGA